MAYKIKRPVTTYYIPLSDKIEKQLDNEWKAGRSGMISAQQNCPECGASMYFDKGDSHNDPWWECPKGHGTFSKEKLLSKGKGWRENPDHTGKAPEHRKAALKAERKGAINEPIGTHISAENTITREEVLKNFGKAKKELVSALLKGYYLGVIKKLKDEKTKIQQSGECPERVAERVAIKDKWIAHYEKRLGEEEAKESSGDKF